MGRSAPEHVVLSVYDVLGREVARLVDAFQPDGVLLYQNNGSGSGQEVPHFHLHILGAL